MQNRPINATFWTIVALTIACGIGAGAIALFTAQYGASPNMDQLFGTLTHLFSGGIGAIFGSQATRSLHMNPKE